MLSTTEKIKKKRLRFTCGGGGLSDVGVRCTWRTTFSSPGESPRRKGILDTSRKGLLRTHARSGDGAAGRWKRTPGARPRSPSPRGCAPGVLALVNRVYAAVHGLRRGPFARGDQVVEWFDEDGDGKVSASEFAVKMRVRIPSDWRGGSSSAARVRRDNDFRVVARLSQTRRVIEVARDGLMRALEGRANTKRGRSTGTIVLSEVAKALKVFVDTFSHLGHQRLINHRFLEVSECISRFPASALVTRAGVRALDISAHRLRGCCHADLQVVQARGNIV